MNGSTVPYGDPEGWHQIEVTNSQVYRNWLASSQSQSQPQAQSQFHSQPNYHSMTTRSDIITEDQRLATPQDFSASQFGRSDFQFDSSRYAHSSTIFQTRARESARLQGNWVNSDPLHNNSANGESTPRGALGAYSPNALPHSNSVPFISHPNGQGSYMHSHESANQQYSSLHGSSLHPQLNFANLTALPSSQYASLPVGQVNPSRLAPAPMPVPSNMRVRYMSTQADLLPNSRPGGQPTVARNRIASKRNHNSRKLTVPRPAVNSSRKRRRVDEELSESGSEDDDDDDEGLELAQQALEVGQDSATYESMGAPPPPNLGRRSRACGYCQMKCDLKDGENNCQRCKQTNRVCIFAERKKRAANNIRDHFNAQLEKKDRFIESLLKQIYDPYLATPLSIESYRVATSPADQSNKHVVAWRDRMEQSVRTANLGYDPKSFQFTRNNEDSGNDTTSEDLGDDDLIEEGRVSLPDVSVPLGLIANLSMNHNDDEASIAKSDAGDTDVGVANVTYFRPGPGTDLHLRAKLIKDHNPPEILVHGLVTPQEVDKLFDIFFTHLDPFLSLLDPHLHTPALTFARCPFLFTVICAISSRYYPDKSHIYPMAMHFAKNDAAKALIEGWKCVELCQAYILLSIYGTPAKRWEEDRAWLYTGLAIRLATDLNLHIPSTTKPQNEKQEREMLNRTRTWLTVFNSDHSTATHFGRPSTLKNQGMVRNSQDWYKKSKYNLARDAHLCGYNVLLRLVAQFHQAVYSDPDSSTGLNEKIDFKPIIFEYDARLNSFVEEWGKRFEDASEPNDGPYKFRSTVTPFFVGYNRLVMWSFGFQQAYKRGIQPTDQIFFSKTKASAKLVLTTVIEVLAPSGYIRFAPDSYFTFTLFASAFLLKLCRPEFSSMVSGTDRADIFNLIGTLIQTLSSPKIAIDDRHLPRIHARFLTGLLERQRKESARAASAKRRPPSLPQGQQCNEGGGSGGVSNTNNSFPGASNEPTFSSSRSPFQSHQRSEAPASASEQRNQNQFSISPSPQSSSYIFNCDFGPIEVDPALINVDIEAYLQCAMSSGGTVSGNNADAQYSLPEDFQFASMQSLESWQDSMIMPGFPWGGNSY